MSPIRLVLAQTEDLEIHKDELVEMMADYALLIGCSEPEYGRGEAVYEKLMRYFGLGKANVWLAVDGRKAVGYAQFFQKSQERVHLNAITVAKGYQNQGVGSMLVEAVERSAKECGADIVELFCNESNGKARDFYQGLDYDVERMLLSKQLA